MNTLKKVLATSIFATLSSLAYADSAPYVGLGLTYTQPTTTKVGVFTQDTVTKDTGSTTADLLSSGAHKIGGTFMGGYHLNPISWGSCFLEGELIGRFANNEIKNNSVTVFLRGPGGSGSDTYSLSIKQKESFGALLKAGKYLTDAFGFYVSAGVLNTKFKTSIQGINPDHGNYPPQYSLAASKTKRVWGGRLGVGLMHDLDKNKDFSLRLDYGYERYKKYSIGNLVYFFNPGTNRMESSLSPSLAYHVVTLSCIYKI